jgi:hypothetical protein
MKKLVCLLLLGVFVLSAAPSRAQEKAAEKAKAEERPKVLIPVRVQIVFTEFDGDKKISSMPYSFLSYANDRNGRYEGTSLRTGVRIPKDQKANYMDVGTNIDCRIVAEEDGRFGVSLVFDRSAIYSGSAGDDKREISHPEGTPVIRSFRTNQNFVLKDGQSSESTLSTEPFTGHSLHVTLTVTTIK